MCATSAACTHACKHKSSPGSTASNRALPLSHTHPLSLTFWQSCLHTFLLTLTVSIFRLLSRSLALSLSRSLALVVHSLALALAVAFALSLLSLSPPCLLLSPSP